MLRHPAPPSLSRALAVASLVLVLAAGPARAQFSTTTVEVGFFPRAVAVDDTGRAFVVNQLSGSVTVIAPDLSTQTVQVGDDPFAVAIDGTGRAFVTNFDTDNVTVIAPDLSTETVAAGDAPRAVAVDDAGRAFVVNASSDDVTVIAPDLSTQTVRVGRFPFAVAVDDAGRAFVTNRSSSDVTVIMPDLSTQTVRVGDDPVAVAVDGAGRTFVTNQFSDDVTVIAPDLSTETVAAGDAPFAVAVDGAGRAFVANISSGDVTVIAPAAPAPIPCTPTAPLSLDADGDGAVTPADFSATAPESVAVRHEADGPTDDAPVDLSTCSLVTFDPFAETVVASVAATGTAAPGEAYVFAESGGDRVLPSDVLFDGPGAFALVAGETQFGADVSSVFGRVVAAVVYDRDGDVFAAVRGGLAEAEARAQNVAFAAALEALSGRTTSTDGGGGGEVDLTVTAWPNPARGTATVAFGIAEGGPVRVAVYDALGREVAVVAEGAFAPGQHEARIPALPAGAYVIYVSGPDGVRTTRFTVAR